jgi:GntR family transcriptional regulator/MocR family aminotransferase
MKEGHFDRHLNRTRLVYQKKIQMIQSLIKDYPFLEMMGNEAGLHFILKVHASIEEHVLVKALRNKKIDIKGLHEFDIEPTTYNAPCLVIGYSGIPLEKIESSIKMLIFAINDIISK